LLRVFGQWAPSKTSIKYILGEHFSAQGYEAEIRA